MKRGSGSEGRRRGGGQHMKCAERQMEELTEDKQTLCSHSVRHLRQAQSSTMLWRLACCGQRMNPMLTLQAYCTRPPSAEVHPWTSTRPRRVAVTPPENRPRARLLLTT